MSSLRSLISLCPFPNVTTWNKSPLFCFSLLIWLLHLAYWRGLASHSFMRYGMWTHMCNNNMWASQHWGLCNILLTLEDMVINIFGFRIYINAKHFGFLKRNYYLMNSRVNHFPSFPVSSWAIDANLVTAVAPHIHTNQSLYCLNCVSGLLHWAQCQEHHNSQTTRGYPSCLLLKGQHSLFCLGTTKTLQHNVCYWN